MKTNWRHECNVLNAPSAAIVVGSLVAAGSSIYASEQQKKLAEDDAKRRERAAEEEQARLDEIAANSRPDGETVEKIEFGSGSEEVGSYNDFIVDNRTQPKMTNSSARAGLGFNV